MTTLAIRQKLMTYLADAEDSKVKALYTLLKDDIQQAKGFTLTDEQIQILEEEHHLHITGQSKSYTREEANEIIRGQRDF
jgi:hypothetical protein